MRSDLEPAKQLLRNFINEWKFIAKINRKYGIGLSVLIQNAIMEAHSSTGSRLRFHSEQPKTKKDALENIRRIRNEIESLDHQVYMGIVQLTDYSPFQWFLE